MYLSQALGEKALSELDESRPLRRGPFELGTEATAEAVRILAGEEFPRDVSWTPRNLSRPMYWLVAHKLQGEAEIFGFPLGVNCGLPTAIEIALVRTIAASSPETHADIFGGGAEIALGPATACDDFRRVVEVVEQPLVGTSLLFNGASQVIIDADISTRLNKITLRCLFNSFRTSPLKFRFLELYRIMEACFLADIKARLISKFDTEPGAALNDAIDSLKSEMTQIVCLAETQKEAFEACWTVLDQLRNGNRFVAALYRRIEGKKLRGGEKWRTGAILIYYMRCAVVHAGERDIIFDNFADGEGVIEEILPYIERAALLLIGIELH